MGDDTREIKCRDCDALLGIMEGDCFEVKRSGLQVSYAGRGHVHIVCYRKNCHEARTLRLPWREKHSDGK
jgi:hypothetical protein